MTCSIRDESAVRMNLQILFFFCRPSTSHLARGGAWDDSQDQSICILLRRIVHELLEALVRHELHFHPILNQRRTSAKEHTWGNGNPRGKHSNPILSAHSRISPSFRWTSLGSRRRRRSVHLWQFSCHLSPCFAGGSPHGRRDVTHSLDMGVSISHSNLTCFATDIHGYSLISWHRRLSAGVVAAGVLASLSMPTSVPCTQQ